MDDVSEWSKKTGSYRRAITAACRVAQLVFLLSPVNWLYAADAVEQQDYFDLSLDELAQIDVATASLSPQSLKELPASVSVITRQQIQELAARDISDLLRLIPGVRVDVGNRGRGAISVRGVGRDSSNHLLFLLDGHALNEPSSGSAAFLFELTRLPLENIQRIEVLRGPGSTVFGANAFLGVVNIITRSAEQVAGAHLRVSSEFDAEGHVGQRWNLLSGGSLGERLGAVINLNLLDRPGEHIEVAADAAGRAGEVDASLRQFDLQARIESASTQLKGRFTRQTSGDHYGVFYQLAPDDGTRFDGGFLELLDSRSLSDDRQLKTRLYADYYQGESHLTTFRRGTAEPGSPWFAFNETGAFSVISLDVAKYGAQLQLTDSTLTPHRLTYGLMLEYQEQSNIHSRSNFVGYAGPFDPLVDTTNIRTFSRNANRTVLAPFVEDVWRLTPDLNLNLGLRLDHYSDFGASLNPRLGVNWRFQPGYRLRALWGTAFRAPDFRSLYLDGDVFVGNPNLQEERVETFEIGLNAQINPHFSVDVTGFHNRLDDIIQLPPGAAEFANDGRYTTRGLELAARYDFLSGTSLTASYTYLDADWDDPTRRVTEPRHSGSLTARLPINGRWRAGLSLFWQSHTPRAEGDSRADLDGYLVCNLNSVYHWSPNLSLEAAVFNLFDQDYAYPAPAGSYPDDLPAPGRSAMLGLSLAF